jgi:hypothetical protein
MRMASVLRRAISLGCGIMASGMACAEHLVQSSTEMRTYIYLQIKDDKLKSHIPEGWISNPGTKLTQGANIALVFIEGLAATDAENKPMPFHDSYVVVGVLAKHLQSGVSTFMVVNGFIPPTQSAPGPYGAYSNAKISMSKQVKADGSGSNRSEIWSFTTDSGERLNFSTEFQLGVRVKSHIEPNVYSGMRPDFYRICKVDQTTDMVHSATLEAEKPSWSASPRRALDWARYSTVARGSWLWCQCLRISGRSTCRTK